MSNRAVCFVMMPFGTKPDATGRSVDFNHVYSEIIAPAIKDAGLESIRADEEHGGGFVHKLMYERLLLSEFAVADLTILNANVYYELGIRHATRPATTVLTLAEGSPLPFDLGPVRALPYKIRKNGRPADAAASRAALAERLKATRGRRAGDSPLFQLLDGYQQPPIDHLKTDEFRASADFSQRMKGRLAAAQASGAETLDELRDELGDLGTIESGVAVSLLLAYRAVSAWGRMVAVCEKFDKALQRTTLVREQWALALNRAGRDREAEEMLKELIAERGPSSETNALLGRIYKDRWTKARKAGDRAARGHLKEAIKAYRQGFEADWRDAYPGVNAVTLMTIADPSDPTAKEMAAVVKYAVRRRLGQKPDYWDHATLLELAAIENDERGASDALDEALAALDEGFKAETTANNLRMIADAREAADINTHWLRALIADLEAAAAAKGAGAVKS